MDLSGRVAVVTGAGRRLGRAIAAALGARGMTVAIHHHGSVDGARELEAELRRKGVRSACFGADLADARQAVRLAGRVAEQFGRIDVLINSAAIMEQLTLEQTTPEAWDRILNLNTRAPFFCAQGAAPYLRKARGRIINLADVGGLEPWAGYAAHSVSKAGVVMLTRVLALALAPEVTVNAIAPGAVLVPDDWDAAARERLAESTPLKRLGSPDDVIGAIFFLLEAGDFVTGQVLAVDGGRVIR